MMIIETVTTYFELSSVPIGLAVDLVEVHDRIHKIKENDKKHADALRRSVSRYVKVTCN